MNQGDQNLSDDDESLELLRAAALQTLKQKQKPKENVTTSAAANLPFHGNKQFNGISKRGRGFHSAGVGRGCRNGRVRNPNLIAIPTEPVKEIEQEVVEVKKLILPQDRYCNKEVVNETKVKGSSKFSRYDDSDNSDTDDQEESDAGKSDHEPDTVKLERSNSLEALMDELEFEINGGKPLKQEESSEAKEEKKSEDLPNTPPIRSQQKTEALLPTPKLQDLQIQKDTIKSAPLKEAVKDLPTDNKSQQEESSRIYEEKQVRKPRQKNWNSHKMRKPNYPPDNFYSNPTQPTPYCNPPNPNTAYNNIPYANPYPPPLLPYPAAPIAPLALNTDALTSRAMAPLSPRSAAFVLQNREIIERRKKSSPKRSYSRSPSPRFRRSKSRSPSAGRRSLSPHKRHYRSKTPPVRTLRRSRSPRKPSPKKRKTPEKRLPAKDRLGKKPDKRSRSPDPVLEARKRKFEEHEVPTEGVIKLKSSEEVTAKEDVVEIKANSPKNEFKDAETEQLQLDVEVEPEEDGQEEDVDTLETKIDDIFSDEESDDDANEGRFKLFTGSSNKKNDSVMPFTQIANGSNKILNKPLEERREDVKRSRSSRSSRHRKSPSPSPKKSLHEKKEVRRRRNGEIAKRRISPEKVVVKAKEKEKKEKEERTRKVVEIKEKPVRKVAIAKDFKENTQIKQEAVINTDDAKKSEGDLRAHISRKRAERQHKAPISTMEDVQSRLLHNALEGAVFAKTKRKEKEAAPKVEKLSVRQRLGLSKVILEESGTPLKKKKKSKRQEDIEQV